MSSAISKTGAQVSLSTGNAASAKIVLVPK
jgi:hypothetical protein